MTRPLTLPMVLAIATSCLAGWSCMGEKRGTVKDQRKGKTEVPETSETAKVGSFESMSAVIGTDAMPVFNSKGEVIGLPGLEFGNGASDRLDVSLTALDSKPTSPIFAYTSPSGWNAEYGSSLVTYTPSESAITDDGYSEECDKLPYQNSAPTYNSLPKEAGAYSGCIKVVNSQLGKVYYLRTPPVMIADDVPLMATVHGSKVHNFSIGYVPDVDAASTLIQDSSFYANASGIDNASGNGGQASTYRGIDVYSNTFSGLFLGWEQFGNRFINSRFFNNGSAGINLRGDSAGLFYNIFAANNGSYGVGFEWADGATGRMVQVTAANNGATGIYMNDSCPTKGSIHKVSTFNNSGRGINWGSCGANLTVSSLVAANNSSHGIQLSADPNTLINTVSLNNGGAGIYDASTGVQTLKGFLLVGNNTTGDCSITSGAAGKGIVNGTCSTAGTDGSSVYGASPSNALLYRSLSAANALVGKASTGDATNTTSGVAASSVIAFGSVTDWLNFDNLFRTWGVDGSAFPNADNRGRCTAGNCRIWDYSLKGSDTILRNTASLYHGSTTDPTFAAGATCPDLVNGNRTITDSASTGDFRQGNHDLQCDSGEICLGNNTYLAHAIEALDDDKGDDDGLCESGEACIYAPNTGAYQGHGTIDTAETCTFVDGIVSSVTMYHYPSNGY